MKLPSSARWLQSALGLYCLRDLSFNRQPFRYIISPFNKIYEIRSDFTSLRLSTMVYRAVIERPSDFAGGLQNVYESNEAETCLTFCIYKALEEEDVTSYEDSDAHPFGRRLVEPLYHAWALALREVEIGPRLQKGKVIFDITRPRFPVTNLMQYEARGLARISALLRHKLRNMATSEATIEGAPCWCVLHESEKHTAALPKGPSWPLSRASHHSLDGISPRGPSRCLNLANEHWDDEHWTMSESI